MKRIKGNAEFENEEIVRAAWYKYSDGKHSRPDIVAYESELGENLRDVLRSIESGDFVPKGYRLCEVQLKKKRTLAIAPVEDHVTETAMLMPYEQQIYDRIVWQAPAVRPGLGNGAMLRFLRNDLFNSSQQEVAYCFTLDVHQYFPLMDHAILKERIDRFFKPGKVRDMLYLVVDSYLQGIPLGIKVAQYFGMMYLSDFDRLCLSCFHIRDDPDKLAYWTSRYITERIMTARQSDYIDLSQGSQHLAKLFRSYLDEGLQHYYRFVDNIIILHQDKVFLRIVRELVIVYLVRDYHCIPNDNYAIFPTYVGIHICGYVFYHEYVALDKCNKKNLCKKAAKLFKKGFSEEQVRVKLSSYIGFAKHVDTTNLLKTIGMDKSLGKIINKRRVKSPFEGLTADNKVKFMSIVSNSDKICREGNWDGKILLLDYIIQASKIDKKKQIMSIQNSEGEFVSQEQEIPEQVLAIKFKKVIKTFKFTGERGEEIEQYQCVKRKDANGNPTEEDAVFYCFTGSKIMIDQALNDFSLEDLPCPTYIIQEKTKSGKDYTKFS